LGWVVKLQLFVGWVKLWLVVQTGGEEESDCYCHIAHCILSTFHRKSCFRHKA